MARWLPEYDRRWLRGDLAAGVAVTALIVPKNLGYAGIAGVPLQNGLYAAAAGGDHLRALLHLPAHLDRAELLARGRRRRRRVRPGSAASEAAQLVAAIALVDRACCSCWSRSSRLGWIAQFLSKAVVTGFLAGAAIDVVIGELPKLTGTRRGRQRVARARVLGRRSLGDTHAPTVLVGGVALAVILGLRRLAPAVPGALVLVAGGLLASALFDLGDHGVALVGDVPRGLPVPELPDLDAGRGSLRDGRHRGRGAAADRLLPDGGRRPGLRRPPPLSHRHQPGVRRPGHGERRRRRVPGHAGVHEPVGQLAQRVRGRADAGRPRWSPEASCSPPWWSSRPCSRTCPRRCWAR